MDDVAKELSVSKKTLYQHFRNKDELVKEVASLHMQREKVEFDQIAESASNAIEELFLLSKCMREHVFKINPSLLYDLEKYHADAWEIFQQFKKQTIMKQVIDNLQRGIDEGFYRKDIEPKVLAILRMEVIQMAFNDRIYPRDQFEFVEVQMQIFDHFVHGLLTDEGRNKYKHYHTQEDKLVSK